jgi:hypothetical protein
MIRPISAAAFTLLITSAPAAPHAPAVSAVPAVSVHLTGASADAPGASLDQFMERVLARRDDNWKKLQQYVLEEQERLQLTGPDGNPVYGFVRKYTWFIRQGYFIRSPLMVDGVRISEADRERYERRWMERESARERRAAERARKSGEASGVAGAPAATPPATIDDVLKETLEPRFVSAAYFLRFKFDPGHYALAGRERLGDRDVLRIEYYPSRLFTDRGTRPSKGTRDGDDRINEQMNKTSLVTLWIDPAEHQILQYTFENIDMDFLPGRAFVRIDELQASMRMAQPFTDVWLPASIAMQFRMSMALGSVAAQYDVEYRDYRLAEVTTRIRPGI